MTSFVDASQTCPPNLHLVLSKTCLEFDKNGVHVLVGKSHVFLTFQNLKKIIFLDLAFPSWWIVWYWFSYVNPWNIHMYRNERISANLAGFICSFAGIAYFSGTHSNSNNGSDHKNKIILQMLRKSVETRDWLNCLEPRTVRAVMKRVVEELSSIESVLGDLYEMGTKTSASSDSSRKTHLRYVV